MVLQDTLTIKASALLDRGFVSATATRQCFGLLRGRAVQVTIAQVVYRERHSTAKSDTITLCKRIASRDRTGENPEVPQVPEGAKHAGHRGPCEAGSPERELLAI